MKRTGQEFKHAAIKSNITQWDSHDCSICGYMVGWLFEDNHERVLFDHGCDCMDRYRLSQKDWDDVAHHYNIQEHPEVIAKMDAFWGFKLEQIDKEMTSDIQRLLGGRLARLERDASADIAPGVMDSYEKEQLMGRIKELRLIIKLLASHDISKAILELENELNKQQLDMNDNLLKWWWLSYADESEFKGVNIILAPDFKKAHIIACAHRINPGGQVCGFPVTDEALKKINLGDTMRLLNKDEALNLVKVIDNE